ncbi:hypothetical protein [Streptomyces cavernae]|uniref:hypothetical protein n=1 Tax=Streptomyces cavernae TaxID=2259034 RepID=UPI000FEB97E6|nr:hypothetical protein [Streptomyces cavernae]
MQGPGYVPQRRPSTGTLVALRVTFVGLALISVGFLAWTAMLRLAVVTQKIRDWFLFVLATALDISAIALLATDPGDEITTWRGELGMVLLLGTLAGVIAYYLAVDIRHYQQPQFAVYPQPAYGYPPQGASPYGTTRPQTPMSAPPMAQTPTPQPLVPQPPLPQTPVPQPQPPLGGPQLGQTPVPPPPQPGRPAPARIDQVRAELDELSDYLRKHDGGSGGAGGSAGSGGSFEGGR